MYFSLRGKKKNIEHVSRWFITINSNRVGIENIKPLKQAYEGFYKNIKKFLLFMDEGNENNIIEISDDPVIGIGKIYSRVHIHSLITIKHTTKIHLNFDKIRLFFSKLLGYNVHFDARVIKDFEINIRNYLMKNYEEAVNQNIKNLNELLKEENE